MTQAAPYQYATSLQANQALALRLNDTAYVHWSKAELNLYIAESLRVYNCLTQIFLQDWTTTYVQPNPATLPAWQSTGNNLNSLVGSNASSPRTQTLNDAYVYTVAQYHLLEPPTGNAAWTGTSQFSLADFSQALQRCRDTVLQITACNVGPFSNTFSLLPGTNRVELPDASSQSILDVRRVRILPAENQGSPYTVFRDDTMAFEYFQSNYETETGSPLAWDMLGSPPLFLTFNVNMNVPNTLDILAVLSGGIITPPTNSPLLVPDDWSWVLKFGMMADMLAKEAESTDLERAQYCEQRFREGIRLMMEMPWMTQARINNVPVDTPSVTELDQSQEGYEWQSNPSAWPAIVRGGIDLFAVCPTPPAGTTQGVTLTLVGNAPIPAADGDYIQVGRDVLDAILDEAQHLAQIKHGGAEFKASIALHQDFLKVAMETNSRLKESGIFPSVLRPPVSREDEAQPRFSLQEKE